MKSAQLLEEYVLDQTITPILTRHVCGYICFRFHPHTKNSSPLLSSENTALLTPILAASFAGNYRCIRVLVKYGAKLDVVDARGAGPLALAAVSGSPVR